MVVVNQDGNIMVTAHQIDEVGGSFTITPAVADHGKDFQVMIGKFGSCSRRQRSAMKAVNSVIAVKIGHISGTADIIGNQDIFPGTSGLG
jgi:hypothetical protein